MQDVKVLQLELVLLDKMVHDRFEFYRIVINACSDVYLLMTPNQALHKFYRD